MYICNITGEYYGTWEIVSIYAVDENGNSTTVYNTSYSGYNPNYYYAGVSVEADLSAANFDVGIFDEETGVFVTGNGMDENAVLDVTALQQTDPDFAKLIQDGYYENSFYEVSMTGTYNKNHHKVKVKFKPKNVKDGDKIRIRHLLKDGTIQTKDAIVENGMIWIEVDQFSPFLLETTNAAQSIQEPSSSGVTVPEQISGPKAGTVLKDSTTGNNYEVIMGADGTVSVGYAGGNTRAKKVTIPSSVTIDGVKYAVTAITDNAFKNNKKLTAVSIPTGVTSIGNNAFKGCSSLKKLVLPKTTVNIGKNAFSGCKKLKSITIKSTNLNKKTISKKAFAGIGSDAVIKVPAKKVEAYTKLFRSRGLSKKIKVGKK